MLDVMERHTGKLPIIYTDMNFHRDILAGEYFPNAFWLRSTAAEPHERYDNRPWTFWQYTQTGVVPGVKGEVDRNVFYGGQEEWLMFLWTGCDPAPSPRSRPPDAASRPNSCRTPGPNRTIQRLDRCINVPGQEDRAEGGQCWVTSDWMG